MLTALRRIFFGCLLLIVIPLLFASGQHVLAFNALGSEFLVNTTTANRESMPAAAMNGSGDFVIAWQSESPSGSRNIIAQRYNASGAAQFGEFQVNGATLLLPQTPAAAMDAAGNFVIVWAGRTLDQLSTIIQAQRYSAAGILQGGAITAAVFSGTGQAKPGVAMDAAGDFVVTWQQELTAPDVDVYARRYNALGVAQGTAFLVHAASTEEQSSPRVAMTAAGSFVIVWTHRVSITDYDIYARHFDAAGAALGTAFRVNSYTAGIQSHPTAAVDDAGRYVVVWQGAGASDSAGIHAQRFDAADVAQGEAILVNGTTIGTQNAAYVTMSGDGKFMVTWEHDTNTYTRMYDAAGVPLSIEMMVNVVTTGSQGFATAAVNATGTHAIIAWTHNGAQANTPDVYARRYSIDVPSPIATVTPLPTLSTFTTTISENEFYAAFEEQRAAFPDIAQGIADFVPDAIDMTIRLSAGEVGVVRVNMSSADGFIIISLGTINGYGSAVSQNYIAVINRDLALLLTQTLDAILVGRFGAGQNVEGVSIDNNLMTLTMLSP